MLAAVAVTVAGCVTAGAIAACIWVFRFDAQGKRGGELRLTREQLASDGWRVDIPVEIGQHLAEQGAPPTP